MDMQHRQQRQPQQSQNTPSSQQETQPHPPYVQTQPLQQQQQTPPQLPQPPQTLTQPQLQQQQQTQPKMQQTQIQPPHQRLQTQPQSPQTTHPQPPQQQQQTQPQPAQPLMPPQMHPQPPQQQQSQPQPPQSLMLTLMLTQMHPQPPQHQQQPSQTQPPQTLQQQQTQPQSPQTQMQPSQQQQQTQLQPPQTQMPKPTHQQLQQRQTQQRPVKNLPRLDLVQGPREEYLKYGVPLYEASIKCNWKAAEAILVKKRELVRYSITENGETPLHVAASAKGDSKRVEEFVKNLVGKMVESDLALQNKNYNTALHLAAAAGNLEIVKILVNENRELLKIPGSEEMMPLYTAVLFGNKDVVDHIFEESHVFTGKDGWNTRNRGWLLAKCVENNMFDTALKIVNKCPDLESGNVLRILAGKPEAFLHETKSSIMCRTIKSVFGFICCKPRPIKKSNAFALLRFIWDGVVKKPKRDIDAILRGLPDSNQNKQDNKTISGWAVKVMQLQKVIYEHVEKMKVDTQNIMKDASNITKGQPSKSFFKLHNLISQRLVNMHVETQNIMKDPSNSSLQENKSVSNKEHLALELQKLIFKHIADMHDKIVKIMMSNETDDRLAKLERGIFEHIDKMENEANGKTNAYANETYSSRVLFLAAAMGNTNFLVERIRQYPDLIWKVNDNNHTIFHTAVKHRQEGVYNMLYEIGAMKDLLTVLKDPKDNNMLHLVGKIATQKRLKDVSGVALQMQLELLWFKEVKNMIPPSYRERVNEDGLTPHELFTKEHKDLVTLGEKWMKGTASQCMVVAALIATIAFAATFTVPGGYAQNNDKENNQKLGIPVFHSKAFFVIFVVADAISLVSSSAAILMFLSILTSRYAEHDFLKSLPKKLLGGLTTLFLSITTMMVAFGVSFFVLYNEGFLWMPIFICVLVVFPTLLYVWLQYGLFFDVIRSSYRSRHLFKPQKQVLYYENPKL